MGFVKQNIDDSKDFSVVTIERDKLKARIEIENDYRLKVSIIGDCLGRLLTGSSHHHTWQCLSNQILTLISKNILSGLFILHKFLGF